MSPSHFSLAVNHLGLLFPIALFFGGYWRAFFAAVVTTLAVLALSWAIAPESLAAFAAHMGGMSDNFLSQGTAGFYKQQSLYGVLRMLGAGDRTAFLCQGLLLLAIAAFVARLWRSPQSFALKCAGLSVAALLATPYLYFYDFPILAIAVAFLWRDGSFSRGETALLIASKLVMAAFTVVNAPLGFAGAVIVLIVIAGRLAGRSFRTAPEPRPA